MRIREENNNACGGHEIGKVMEREGTGSVPSKARVTEILGRHGKLELGIQPHISGERDRPNELWQIDFKGDFALPAGAATARP